MYISQKKKWVSLKKVTKVTNIYLRLLHWTGNGGTCSSPLQVEAGQEYKIRGQIQFSYKKHCFKKQTTIIPEAEERQKDEDAEERGEAEEKGRGKGK